MPLEYVKHDREITPDDMQKHGKFATHDIKVPIVLAYELGNILDKNGTPVVVDKKFINKTMDITNKAINARSNSPFAKMKSWFSKPIEQLEFIPIIKNHKTDDVNGVMGYSQGLLYQQDIEGVTTLLVHGIITRIEDKKSLSGGLLRATSIGTRADGSIKEISFVVNPAMPEGGPLFSEHKVEEINPQRQFSEQELQFMEQITELEFQEAELRNYIIPNHIVISKLIKTGRLQPWKYDSLIKSRNTEALELMENCTVGLDLGLMRGTSTQPLTKDSPQETAIDAIVNKYKSEKQFSESDKKSKSTLKKDKKELNPPQDGFITGNLNFEELREQELKNIKELIDHDPSIAKKYICVELGEHVDQEEYCNDKYLSKYINDAKDLTQKINNLKIQLGEYQND